MKRVLFTCLLLFITGGISNPAFSHCEIPCGIYADETRIELMLEDVETIEKSMLMINELEEKDSPNMNQLVRWITNKELHANKLQEKVYQYFMTQRINVAKATDKEAYDKYVDQIILLHQMLVEAMRAKQTTDFQHIRNLRALIGEFRKIYFDGKEHDHESEG